MVLYPIVHTWSKPTCQILKHRAILNSPQSNGLNKTPKPYGQTLQIKASKIKPEKKEKGAAI